MREKRQFGREYSAAYDYLYGEKDYEQESRFLKNIIEELSPIEVHSILSLGCGTCTPDILLAKKGYKVHGVDLSQDMISIANQKVAEDGLQEKISLEAKDIRELSFNEEFDFAMALFNVAGYWRTNEDVDKVFGGVSKALKKGGLFVFDGWYGPAVLRDRPGDRVREIIDKDRRIIRTTHADLDLERNMVDINFHLLTIEDGKLVSEVKENHPARYWFLQELDYYSSKNGLEILRTCTSSDLDSHPSEDSWDLFIVAQKR